MTYTRTTAAAALTTVLLGTGLVLTSVPAHADPLTCQGVAVTVDGTTGTDGDDVMVVTQQSRVASGSGNDLVCIRITSSAEPFHADLDAGPGDDIVVNESTDGNVRIVTLLGAGADTYTGSDASSEVVVAGATGWQAKGDTSDTERDVIDTAAGDDVIYSGSVSPGLPNQDQITMGAGMDRLHWAGEQAGPAADLGLDRNSLLLYPGLQGTDLAVDATSRIVTVDARPVLRWSGDVTAFSLMVDILRTKFTGSDADESLRYDVAYPGTVSLPNPARWLDANMGAGNDSIAESEVVGGSLVGGEGDDSLQAGRCLEADVRLGQAFTCLAGYSPRVEYTSVLDAWEHVQVPGGIVRVVGTSGPDHVLASGSRVRVLGRGGDDFLAASGSRSRDRTPWTVVLDGGPGNDAVTGGYGHDKLLGGAGRDLIAGSSGDDLLLGGAGADRLKGGKGRDDVRGGQGRDRANGEAGRDACAAEVRRSCERT